jgi:hypothetical protein
MFREGVAVGDVRLSSDAAGLAGESLALEKQ